MGLVEAFVLHLRTWHNSLEEARKAAGEHYCDRIIKVHVGVGAGDGSDVEARYLLQTGISGFINSYQNIANANCRIITDATAGFSVHALAVCVSKQIARGQDFCVWNGSMGIANVLLCLEWLS